jgi:hypothetical protein
LQEFADERGRKETKKRENKVKRKAKQEQRKLEIESQRLAFIKQVETHGTPSMSGASLNSFMSFEDMQRAMHKQPSKPKIRTVGQGKFMTFSDMVLRD